MEMNQESASTLFHYCNEIANALRGVLNTHKFEDMDQSFWNSKLSEFKIIIEDILGDDPTIKEGFQKANHILATRDKIFCQTLKSLIKNQPDLKVERCIEISNDVANDSIEKLYGVKL